MGILWFFREPFLKTANVELDKSFYFEERFPKKTYFRQQHISRDKYGRKKKKSIRKWLL